MVGYTQSGEIAELYQNPLVLDTLATVKAEYRAGMALLTEREQQLLAEWNTTQRDYSRDVCVPQLVATQAVSRPEAVALVAGDQALSYGELNRRANQLAHYLQKLGVGPNVLVGLCMERSLDMVVGLLGILKAGAAYVPMDPSYPPGRLKFMVEDAHVSVLLTQQSLSAHFATDNIHVLCLDSDATLLAQQSIVDPPSLSTITDLAYVIYTSGSTGQPKGVQITHDSLLNLVFWHQRAFGVTASDRATQVASPAFDATGWELWPYLTIGASMYLPDEDTRVTPTMLRDWLLSRGITIAFLPTPLAESVMTLEWPATAPLRILLTGADRLQHYPSPTLPFAVVNNYGPTEATVVATFGLVPATTHADELPSIGRPIDNTQIYILDEALQQVPIGEPGELHIGGAGLALGYLNRPELTTEKFIPHPFSNEPNARLYKTGDLARYLPDGQIAFLGRADQQVKIRGFRIELGEIESVLNRHPSVRQAVVTALDLNNMSGEKRLVAYLMIDQDTLTTEGATSQISNESLLATEPLSESELRSFLLVQLPDYMIPTIFVQVNVFPLTPNGKIDRAALPAPSETNRLRDSTSAAPSTPIEKRLAVIMSSLLGLEQIGREDNFFMLGGHSMLGTQVIMRVSEIFGVEIPLRTLFDAPTVEQLADKIERLLIAQVELMSDEEVQRLLEQAEKELR